MLGKALGVDRKNVTIATKSFGRTGLDADSVGLSRQHLIRACEASLRRLGTDWIDLYQLHEFDALVPLEETLEAMDQLKRGGKVRYIGCSNFSGWQFTKALNISERLRVERFTSHQIYYSLLGRDAEHELLPAAIDQDIGVLVWGPLASGYLTGKFAHDGTAPEGTRLSVIGPSDLYDPATAPAVVQVAREIAESRNVSIAQVAINWLLRKPGVTSVILGARNEKQLRDNVAAAGWKLSDSEVARLDEVSRTRVPYPLSHQRSIYAVERNPASASYRD
jgi:aryl-alcohol dehydrogenase-like predicted oxidoreductase